jgi:hypothetical protein
MTNTELSAFIKKNPVGVGCIVLALALGVFSFYRSDRVGEASARLEQKTTEGDRLATNLKYGVQLPEQLAAITASSQQIASRLVRADELAQNLQYFYKLEADTATKLIDLRQVQASPAKGAKKTAFAGISYIVNVQGEYAQLIDFLRRLESGQHYCRVMTAALSGSGPERGSPLKLSLTLELLGQP